MKEWLRGVDAAGVEGVRSKWPLFSARKTQANVTPAVASICWSSSSDEDEADQSKNRLVVTRLNFEQCVRSADGRVKSRVSRCLIDGPVTKTPDRTPALSQSKKNSSQIPAEIFDISSPDLHSPQSPILSHKKRRGRTRANKSQDLNTSQNMSPKSPILHSPKSPIISSSRKRKHKAQANTHRPSSPIVTRSRGSNIVNRRSLSPVISRRKKHKTPVSVFGKKCGDNFKVPCSPVINGLIQSVVTSQDIEDSSQEHTQITSEPRTQAFRIVEESSQEECESNDDQEHIDNEEACSQATTDSLDVDSCQSDDKPIRNGLVWNLNKVVSEHHMSQRLRHFRFASNITDSQENHQQLVLLRMEKQHMKCLAHCLNKSTKQRVCVLLPPDKISIKVGSLITIFEPWYQVETTLGKPLLLGVELIHVQPPEESSVTVHKPKSVTKCQKFDCLCRQDIGVSSKECTFQLPTDLWKLLLWPHRHKTNSQAVERLENKELNVASAVTDHSKNPTSQVQLILRCQRLCPYKLPGSMTRLVSQSSTSQNSSDDDCAVNWQALGQDLLGELCVVELGSKPGKLREGGIFHLKELTLSKRLEIVRNPSLLSLLASVAPRNSQDIVFEFTSHNCQATQLELNDISWVAPQLLSHDLFPTSHEEPRLTLLAYLLYTKEADLLYVQPKDWPADKPPYLKISVCPLGYIPHNLTSGTLLCLRDLQVLKGELYIDRYSAVIPLDTYHGPLASPWLVSLQTLNPTTGDPPELPSVSKSSAAGDIVLIQGTVSGVDEEAACLWPVCAACGCDVLRETTHKTFECVLCNTPGPFFNRVSLTVNLVISGLHASVQLQQDTIEQMLPGVQHASDGYQLEVVLDQRVGPLRCIVAERSHSNVSLEEIPHPVSRFPELRRERNVPLEQ